MQNAVKEKIKPIRNTDAPQENRSLEARIIARRKRTEQRNAKIMALITEWMLENNKKDNGESFASVAELIRYLKDYPEYKATTPKFNTQYKNENIGTWLHTLRVGHNQSVTDSDKELLQALRIPVVTLKNSNVSRQLDTRKAAGEQLKPLAQKPRRIINYASPLSVGTALLNGQFEKDATNVFNPDGLNTPDSSPKHDRQYPPERSFTDQEAIETTLYKDIRDLLHCLQSRTNFPKPPSRRQTPHNPEVRNGNAKLELYKISAAADFVLELAELADKEDGAKLLAAYEACSAEPENRAKAAALVDIMKDIKIKYDENLCAAYLLVFSAKYKDISLRLDELLNKTYRGSEDYSMIKETEHKLTVLNACDLYNIRNDPNNYSKYSVRLIRINLKKLLPELEREITIEAEALLTLPADN
jgi:hypothetical protein